MEKTTRITSILILAVAFCFVLLSLAQAEEKVKSLTWVDHAPNPRFATKEELLSIVIPSKTYPPLPKGHPFVNFKYSYWTGTTHEDLSDDAYFIDHEGVMWGWSKMFQLGVWPVLEK